MPSHLKFLVTKMERLRILLAVDGSEQSMNAVRYVGALFPPGYTEIVLFHVRASVPESFSDLGESWREFSETFPLKDWQDQSRKSMDLFLRAAEAKLLGNDFPAKSLSIYVKDSDVGITRDILAESGKGFNAVVVGRNGINQLRDIVIGSVAAKLIEKTLHVPVIVVGGDPSPEKILVAYDGSAVADKAVDTVGSLLSRSECSVKLCQVVRPLTLGKVEDKFVFRPKYESKWEESVKKQITPALENAQNRLVKDGFSSKRLSYEILTGQLSRAGNIVEKAKKGGYGTIVVGRRGLTIVEEFASGRVTRKVLDMSAKLAVWVIN